MPPRFPGEEFDFFFHPYRVIEDPGDQSDSPTRREEIQDTKAQVDLFERAPSPPTGPLADPHTREEGKPLGFVKFMESDDGAPFWRALQDAALDAFRRQETRFSPRGFLAHYRDTKKVRLNNNFSPWFADMLVTEHPHLIDIVERRMRKKAGPSIQPKENI